MTLSEAMNRLYALIPADVLPYLPADFAGSGVSGSGRDPGFLIRAAAQMLTGLFRPFLHSLALLLGILLLSAMLSLLRQSFGDGLGGMTALAGQLALSVALFQVFESLWREGFAALDELRVFMNAMLPVMTSLYAAGGQFGTAAAAQSGMMAALTVLEQILTGILTPLLRFCFAFAVVGNVGNLPLSGISALIRRCFSVLLGFVMALFSLILAYQNRIALGADNVASRSLRFAAGNFIPIVGGTVGEAVRVVLGSIQSIRSAVGWSAIVVLALLLLPALLRLYGGKLLLWGAASAGRLLGCDRESAMLEECASLMDMLLAMTFALSVMFLLSLTLFITAGVGVS